MNSKQSNKTDKAFVVNRSLSLKYFIIIASIINALFIFTIWQQYKTPIRTSKVISCPENLINYCRVLKHVGDAPIENVIRAAHQIINSEDRNHYRNETISFNNAQKIYLNQRSNFIRIGVIDGVTTSVSPQFIRSEVLLRLHAQNLLEIIGTIDV